MKGRDNSMIAVTMTLLGLAVIILGLSAATTPTGQDRDARVKALEERVEKLEAKR